MRFLIDENLSPRICALLSAGGHHATHIRDHGMTGVPADRGAPMS
ncbi:MAG: DUF5615 family PIN-like protein [Pseudonocardiales bacterium]|nr:DUF5615 family PIN-like protein [Pseudonocardiales bacterium]